MIGGAILTVILDTYHSHDMRLFLRIWEGLKHGDVILGDRLFGDYATLADLPRQGIDVVARLNAKRKVDSRRAKRLGQHNDGLFIWAKSKVCPPYLTLAQWAERPTTITVRIVRFHPATKAYRSRSILLITTLLDPKLYPLEELADLKNDKVEVIGASFDSTNSHQKFIAKYNLNFPLPADTDGKIADAYEVKMADRNMTKRVSFLIGLDGKIAHITDTPSADTHLSGMKEAVTKLK